MNTVTLFGRLTRDIEIRYTNDQKAVGAFTLAVDRPGKDKGADFIRCVAFEKIAQNMEKFTTKGYRVAVEGSIKTGSYEGKDGKTVYTTDIYAHRVHFIDFKEKGAQNGAQNVTAPDGFEDITMDIPF